MTLDKVGMPDIDVYTLSHKTALHTMHIQREILEGFDFHGFHGLKKLMSRFTEFIGPTKLTKNL